MQTRGDRERANGMHATLGRAVHTFELAQLDHAGYGALFTVIAGLYHHVWIGMAIAAAWALLKELYIDPFRHGDSWKDNLTDLGFWAIGILVGFLLVYF